MTAITGASGLLEALEACGVSVCFANPGTTELDLVRGFESRPGIRCVLGLQENVCTGAADGYARMTGRPAMTVLHLGPGFANGIANLHNARRAYSPVVNVIGDHTSWHVRYDPPLASDIESLARPVSGWVHRIADARDAAPAALEAVRQSRLNGGQGATLIFPADFQAATADFDTGASAGGADGTASPAFGDALSGWVARLRGARRVVMLLGGGGERGGLGARAQRAAARVCRELGAQAYAETFPARAERGRGLPAFDRLPYFPEPARAVLDPADLVVLAGTREPITYFGYEGHPSALVDAKRLMCVADVGEDVAARLEALADALGAPPCAIGETPHPEPVTGALTPEKIAATVARLLPEHSIVSVEGGTCGYPFYAASASAAVHTALTNTGGAIGQGLPVAFGAAIACPQRTVVALLSDGSTQYTVQTLWSLAHEQAHVIVLIAANHQYGILRKELNRGNASIGARAQALTSLDVPRIDWVGLARSYGVPGERADTAESLAGAFERAVGRAGPSLIEMAL